MSGMSTDRIQNRPLSGEELSKIIQKRVGQILAADGMFIARIGYANVAFEVKITLHLDNPAYPQHVTTVIPSRVSIQELEANPELGSIEGRPPLASPTEDALVISTELSEIIQSPNGSRIEHDLPLKQQIRNVENMTWEDKEVMYTGDKPEPESVGNTMKVTDTSTQEAARMGVSSGQNKGNKKGGKA